MERQVPTVNNRLRLFIKLVFIEVTEIFMGRKLFQVRLSESKFSGQIFVRLSQQFVDKKIYIYMCV